MGLTCSFARVPVQKMRWRLVGASLWLLLALAVSDVQARDKPHSRGCGLHRGKRKRNGSGKSAFKDRRREETSSCTWRKPVQLGTEQSLQLFVFATTSPLNANFTHVQRPVAGMFTTLSVCHHRFKNWTLLADWISAAGSSPWLPYDGSSPTNPAICKAAGDTKDKR